MKVYINCILYFIEVRSSVLLRIRRSNIISAKFKLRQSPYLANAQLCLCITDRPTVEVHSKFGHGLINLAEMIFHAVRGSFSHPSVTHALLIILLGEVVC